MGKTQWKIWGQGKRGANASQSSSYLWASWDSKDWEQWTQSKGAKQVFPQYHDMELSYETVKDDNSIAYETEDDDKDTIRAIQKNINVIRKTENRLRKVAETRQKRDQQWNAFQAEMRKTFLEQKHKYKMDVKKFEEDQKEILTQRREAAEALKQCINGRR